MGVIVAYTPAGPTTLYLAAHLQAQRRSAKFCNGAADDPIVSFKRYIKA